MLADPEDCEAPDDPVVSGVTVLDVAGGAEEPLVSGTAEVDSCLSGVEESLVFGAVSVALGFVGVDVSCVGSPDGVVSPDPSVGVVSSVGEGDLESVGDGDFESVGEGDFESVGDGDFESVGDGDLESVGDGEFDSLGLGFGFGFGIGTTGVSSRGITTSGSELSLRSGPCDCGPLDPLPFGALFEFTVSRLESIIALGWPGIPGR